MSTTFSNITIPVPAGTTNHGDPHLLCIPSNWFSILSFFLANYVTHAATVLSYPGESRSDYASGVFLALLFPAAGFLRGFNGIIRLANLGTDDLTKAARAGALCMVIHVQDERYDPYQTTEGYHRRWWPFTDLIPNDDIGRKRTIHGVSGKIKLPPGYAFAFVPRDAHVISRSSAPATNPFDVNISASSNATKIIVAIVQAIYGFLTLYRTRGDQVERYGYAAFGLTVAPYAVMSIVNLLGCLMTHSYPTMYLVHSAVLDEVNEHHNQGHPYFDGAVGTLAEVSSRHRGSEDKRQIQRVDTKWERRWWLCICPYIVPVTRLRQSAMDSHRWTVRLPRDIWDILRRILGAIMSLAGPLIITGAISKFHKGKSTKAQRVWIMMWLAFGSFVGSTLDSISHDASMGTWGMLAIGMIYCAPAIGGFIVVGQMLMQYGDCIRLA